MVKIIGLLLIASGLLSLAAGTFLEIKYGNAPSITGNVISNIITQPNVHVNFVDYIEGTAFSYSIISMIVGAVFLFRI